MIADTNIARRRGQQLDHNTIQHHFHQPSCYAAQAVEEPIKRSSRPVSWHPSSNSQAHHLHHQYTAKVQHQLEQQQHSQQTTSYPNLYAQYIPAYALPTPAAYVDDEVHLSHQYIPSTPMQFSTQNSPVTGHILSETTSSTAQESTESPPHYFAPANWHTAQHHADSMSYGASPEALESFPSFPVSSATNWDQTDRPGDYYGGVTPPTPQDTQASQHHEAVTVTSEDSIPYEPLEIPEDEGEILVGMGLYEDPEKVDDDSWLGNYRKTTSDLLGTTYRRVGQGLKLEESWEPPASDDENDGDDSSSDRDADGEDQDDVDSPEDTQAWI